MNLADVQFVMRGSVVIARISGEIDMSNVTELRDALSRELANDALGMVLDLRRVSYIDSAGIGLLYRMNESLRIRGQKLRLVIPDASAVSDTLRLAGADSALSVFQTLDDALR